MFPNIRKIKNSLRLNEILRLISIYLFLNSFSVIYAEPLKWYEHPGRWFKNVLSSPDKGKPAPEIDATDLAGNQKFLKDYDDQYILLSFWASWCPLCRKELPELEKLNLKYANKGFKILAINVHDSREDALNYLNKNKSTLIFLLDNKDQTSEKYLISPLPSNFLIQKNNYKIIKKWEGEIDIEEMDSFFKSLIDEKRE